MKLPSLSGNLGLKILALGLAIVIYYALKSESSRSGNNDDKRIFHYR